VNDRIEKELTILRTFYPKVTYIKEGQWILIEDYSIPPGLLWNREKTNVCFQILVGYPGTPPYGFFVPSGILYDGKSPKNYQESPNNKPPFPSEAWGFFSWAHDSDWKATDNPHSGSNLLSFARSFKDRFSQGV